MPDGGGIGTALSAVGSIAGGLGGGGGSGGGGGGVVVGGPSPAASRQAGLIQSHAADVAREAAMAQTKMALDAVRQSYSAAVTNLRPYTAQGTQALNEMFRYMGMSPFNPGEAPVRPNAPTPVISNDPADRAKYAARYAGGPLSRALQGQSDIGNNEAGAILGAAQGNGMNWNGINLNSAPTAAQFQALSPDAYSTLYKALTPEQVRGEEYRQAKYEQDLAAFNEQNKIYQDQLQSYNQYTAKGPMTPEQIQNELAQTPGYQFQLGQGMDAIQRAASAKGMLGSGRLLQSLMDYGSGLAQQTYGQRLSQLAALAGSGQQAATSLSGIGAGMGQTSAGLQVGLGDAIANSYLAKANAQAQAVQNANMQYQVIGGSDGGGGGGMGGIGQALGGLGSLMGGGGSSSGGGFMGMLRGR